MLFTNTVNRLKNDKKESFKVIFVQFLEFLKNMFFVIKEL